MRRIDPPPASPAVEPPRFTEFDALRATAIGLVVTLHAALAYTKLDIPRLLWGVREPGSSLVIDWGCWWAMAVSVPLFFTIAGFFAARAVASRGAAEFWRGRVRRVVVPSVAGALVILPACFGAWAVGWLRTGRCTWREVCRLRFFDPAIEEALYGPAHLWFVAYLIPILWVYSRSLRRRPRLAQPPVTVPWLARWFAPLVLAALSTALMLIHRRWTGVDAGLDRHNTILPEPLRLLHYGVFFLVGTLIPATPGLLDRLQVRGWFLLAASFPVFLFRGWILPVDWLPDAPLGTSLLACLAGALGSWLSVFGLIGAYGRVCRGSLPVARYLAGASFWVYLVHLPLVGLIQADLVGVAWPVGAKFAGTWTLTVALSLLSYETLVRRTVLGRFLDGRTRHRGPAPVAPRLSTPVALGALKDRRASRRRGTRRQHA